jgi:hypothetical protein
MRRVAPWLAVLVAALVITWSGGWAYAGLQEYASEKRCLLLAGPWLPCGPYDRQGPLLLALLPLAILGLPTLLRLCAAPFRARRRIREKTGLRAIA